MNLSGTRKRHPLAFVAFATIVTVVCFTVVPSDTLEQTFLQTALLAVSMLILLAITQPAVLSLRYRCAFKEEGKSAYHKRNFLFVAVLLLANGLFIGVVTVLRILGEVSNVESPVLVVPTFAPISNIVLFVALCVATGIFEEGFFRGVLSCGFTDALRMEGKENFALLGAIVSAFIFGFLHVTSVPLGISLNEVMIMQLIMKTIQATFFGFIMLAVLFRTGNLWMVATLHAGFNILSMGPAFVVTGMIPSTYITGDPIDLVVLIVSALLLVPPVVYAWRILVRLAPLREH